HEGTISRQTDKLRDRCLEHIRTRLLAQGWTGDDLTDFILTEMGPLLLDEPRLGADRLAGLLAARGRSLPAAAPAVCPPEQRFSSPSCRTKHSVRSFFSAAVRK